MIRWWKALFSDRPARAEAGARAVARLQQAEAALRSGDGALAERLCRDALDVDADCAPALAMLGELAAARGEWGEAEGLFRRALSIDERNAHLHFALGCVLSSAGDPADAETAYRAALAIAPGHAGARNNLGFLLQSRGESAGAQERDLAEAIDHFRAATESAPGSPDGWINLGYALAQQRKPQEAARAYDRALAIAPDHAHARLNRAMANLAQGRWAEAWDDYEWRWPATGFERPGFEQPEWDGGPLAGKTLLLYTEQGYGDAIQFVRYAPLLAARGARVLLRCAPELKTLFESVAQVAQVVAVDEPLPAFDVHASLLGLPRLFGTRRDSIPADVPYLFAPRAQGAASGRRIGLVWASQSSFPGAALKSVPVEALAPLADIGDVEFVGLQVGWKAPFPSFVRDLSGGLRDFADTAALIATLDLVLSVDTAVAHLAGALGRPVWTLLPYVADWRWEPEGDRSAWYPGMRLFRQRRRGDWAEVIARVAGELRRRPGAATSPTSSEAAGA